MRRYFRFERDWSSRLPLALQARILVAFRLVQGLSLERLEEDQEETYLGELAPAARSARAIGVLHVFNSVLEFIAKWAFVIDIAVLFVQYAAEEEQRDQLRKATHDFFCQRFSLQTRFDQFKTTGTLYTSLSGFIKTKGILESTPGMDQTTTDTAVAALGDSFMTTCENREYEVYDKLDTDIYKAEDPNLEEVKRWLKEQETKSPK
ncbi:hypothetical protein B0T17DRAFT_652141 [Bombardia bombarda]|uniref:Uncharacterized protein n=1 Tax=Bombardia bombarda TaxID=252184 RepID=A0AA40C893_9PEZI|nr:hypothetical protein B0T17DRAFT_652141 [Bombardia bombarda]